MVENKIPVLHMDSCNNNSGLLGILGEEFILCIVTVEVPMVHTTLILVPLSIFYMRSSFIYIYVIFDPLKMPQLRKVISILSSDLLNNANKLVQTHRKLNSEENPSLTSYQILF